MIERVGVWLHVPAAASAAEHTPALLAFPTEPRWGVQAHRRSARKAARFKRTMTLTDIITTTNCPACDKTERNSSFNF